MQKKIYSESERKTRVEKKFDKPYDKDMKKEEKYAYSKYWLNYPKTKYIGTDFGVYLLCLIDAMTVSNSDIK